MKNDLFGGQQLPQKPPRIVSIELTEVGHVATRYPRIVEEIAQHHLFLLQRDEAACSRVFSLIANCGVRQRRQAKHTPGSFATAIEK